MKTSEDLKLPVLTQMFKMDAWRWYALKITILYLLLLGFLSYHLPFSMFFNFFHDVDALFKKVENTNNIRTLESQKYFSSLDPTLSLAHYKSQLGGQIDFAIGIITVRRVDSGGKPKSYGYLQQSASSVDALLKEKSIFKNSAGFICNVHSYPSQHTDAVNLYSYLPYIERYGNNSLGISDLLLPHSDRHFKDITKHMSVYQKESYDYVFCLMAAAKLKPSFILLIEEDAIPRAGFPEFLDHLMNFRLKNQDFSKLGYIKFYFPAKWQGFEFSFIALGDLISFCVLGACLFCFINYYFFSCKHNSSINSLIFLGFFTSILTCYVLGRQNVNEIRRISNFLFRMKSADDCCTQAMLYPIQVVEELPHFMISESMSTHPDLIIADFISEKALSAYQIEPNLFHHTGIHSSLPLVQKHPVEFLTS